jgi:hypothetical protein
MKRLSIDRQLQNGWLLLYAIETDDSITEELILAHLEETAKYIAAVRSRKRLNLQQREKLSHLERWYNLYDLKQLKQDVQRKVLLSHKQH